MTLPFQAPAHRHRLASAGSARQVRLRPSLMRCGLGIRLLLAALAVSAIWALALTAGG